MTGGLRLWRVDVVDRKLRSPIPSKLGMYGTPFVGITLL